MKDFTVNLLITMCLQKFKLSVVFDTWKTYSEKDYKKVEEKSS